MNAHPRLLNRLRTALFARGAEGPDAFAGVVTSSAAGSGAPATRVPLAILGSAFAALVAAAALLAGSAAPAAASACANESIRAEQGEAAEALPDCRAYEMVTPNGDIPHLQGTRAAASGDRAAVGTAYPFVGEGTEALFYLSIRGANGWEVHTPIPPQDGAQTSDNFACSPSLFADAEVDNILLLDGWNDGGDSESECIGDRPELVPGEARGYLNLFRTDAEGSHYELMNTATMSAPWNAVPLAATPNLSRVVFKAGGYLTPETPSGGEYDYVADGHTTRLLTRLPDGTPVHGILAGGGGGRQAMSEDGEQIVFETEESRIYLREHALREQSAVNGGGECTEPEKACTIPVDISEEGPTEDYPGTNTRQRYARQFLWASADGSRIFFQDDRKLTPDSTAVLAEKDPVYSGYINEKPDLYEYDVGTGETTDRTVNAGEPANFQGLVNAGADGSYLYFVARGALTGSQENAIGETAQPGEPNLYVLHDGVRTFIGTADTLGGSRVSPNGRYLLFSSGNSLTGDNTSPAEPEDCSGSCREFYLYDAIANKLECASCPPDGAPSLGDTGRLGVEGSYLFSEVGPTFVSDGLTYRIRGVGDSGRAFFQTPNSLTPRDTNEREDVYEYETGKAYLISSGKAASNSAFLDASASGNDVFFTTDQGLAGRDSDEGTTLYDARVDGGFAEPPALPGCEGEACRGAGTTPSSEAGAGTASLHGPGNVLQQHQRDCAPLSLRARKVSQWAKRLRRKAAHARGRSAARLRARAARIAKQAHSLSKKAKTCRRANRRGAK